MRKNQLEATLQFASYAFAQVFKLLGQILTVQVHRAAGAQSANLIVNPRVVIGFV